ncbi:MAG: hypothetical protein IT376_23590 [Polyangiaceae bacterium]|nr:hypothetical protein [Polyangiaceae bacterium]
MAQIGQLFGSVAVLGLALAGLSWIVGWRGARDRLLRMSAAVLLLGLVVLPMVTAMLMRACASMNSTPTGGTTISGWSVVPFVLGHVALAIFLLRRRLRGREHARREADALDRARTRERPRLAAQPEEPES